MSNTEFANKQAFKAFLAGIIRQPNSRDTPKTTETEAQIIAETNTRGAALHKIKSATRQEIRDFEIGLKHRIIRGTTKIILSETAISFVDKKIIEATELSSDMLKWIYHKQMRGMLEIEQWDTLVDERFRHNPRIFLATVMSDLPMPYLWELIRSMKKSDLDLPLKCQEFTCYNGAYARQSFITYQNELCAKDIEFGRMDVKIPRGSIPLVEAMRRGEQAMLPGFNAWEVKIHPSFMQNTTNVRIEGEIDQGPYVLTEFPSEAAADKVKAQAVAGFHSDGKYYLFSEIIDLGNLFAFEADGDGM